MSSHPSPFVGSASSSVLDAIQSYRRSQYLVAGANVPSTSEDSEFEDDEEAQSIRQRRPFLDDNDELDDGELTPRLRGESFVGDLVWDEDYETSPRNLPGQGRNPGIESPESSGVPPSGEQTPLLTERVSRVAFSPLPHPSRPLDSPSSQSASPHVSDYQSTSQHLTRRLSGSSLQSSKSAKYESTGQSTFGQTLFNSIAILLGIGMLSEPLAFAYAGWLVGTLLIVSYGFLACYTAKVLARVILADPRIRSYSDVGRKAFGPKATPLISLMFCLELFSVSVVLVTLYGDSLHSLMPQYSSNVYKAWGIVLLTPMVFLPLSLLSYTSILGILSTIMLVLVIFIDGFSKKEAPGSLWSPMPTDVGVQTATKLGVAFGLFMAGFSGHAVIPSLARDMVDPSQFDRMINWAFVVAVCIYTVIGYAGYFMFGRNVSDEVSLDLLATPGYNPFLNTVCLWMLVISPLSKFGLNVQPLNATVEVLLGLDAPLTSPEDLANKPDGLAISPKNSHFGRSKRILGILQRIVLTAASITVSIVLPEFSSMMAFVGSFSAFMISIVGPVAAKVAIDRKCGWLDGFIIVAGTIMAVWGTVAAFA